MLSTILKDKKIILASASPRRQELLKGLDINFTTDTQTSFKEDYPSGIALTIVPEYLAIGKSNGFHRPLEDNEIIITADTMVYCNGQILGKPRDRANAIYMLKMLSNNKHTVITGLCIRNKDKQISFTSTSDVYFSKIEDSQIEYYIDKYKPYDKAGAYGVQEWIGYVAITKIDGSYYNVMGLPVQKLYSELICFCKN